MSWVVEGRIKRLREEREVLGSRDGQGEQGGFGGLEYEKQGGDV